MAVEKKKFKSGDDEAEENLALQMKLSGESRFSNILLIILCVGFIYAFAVLFWVLPDNDFSVNENRALAALPEMSVDNLLSGKLTDEFSDYMADQFPLRDFFVGAKAVGEISQLKLENNDVILGDNGYLVARNDYPSEDFLDKNLSAAGKFKEVAKEHGIPCFAAFAGRKIDVCDELIPSVYGTYCSDRIWNILDEKCSEYSLDYINLRDELRIIEQSGEELYYKTDHHWNSLGAYYAYCSIVKRLGDTPYSLSDFTKETVTDSFLGTTYNSSGIKWASPDTIDYYRWDGDTDVTMKILEPSRKFEGYDGCEYLVEDGKTYAVFNSYFVREFLSEKDKYASFIGGNFGYTKITGEGEGRKTLVILKDSFSHSTVQFLARHYDLVMVDLRYYSGSILTLCEQEGADAAVFLYNMETLTENDYLRMLRVGLK